MPNTKKKDSIDLRAYGEEPVDLGIVDNSTLGRALSWYNYHFTAQEAKPWLLQYVKDNYPADIYEAIKAAPHWRTPMTICSLARMIKNGATLPESSMEFLADRILENARHGNESDEAAEDAIVVAPKPRIGPYQRLLQKINRLMITVEEELDMLYEDSSHKFDLYTFLKKEEAAPQAATRIRDYFVTLRQEMLDYKEDFEKKTYKPTLVFYEQMISDCDRMLENKKTARKGRAPVAKTTAKVVGAVKYCKSFDELRLESINPTKIIGARLLWVYNHKYRSFGCYVASSAMGLSVRDGTTTLEGFDPDKSIFKTLRKPAEQLKTFFEMNPKDREKFLDGVTTAQYPLSSRLNADTVLVMVK